MNYIVSVRLKWQKWPFTFKSVLRKLFSNAILAAVPQLVSRDWLKKILIINFILE